MMLSLASPNNDIYIGNLHFTFYGLFLALGMLAGLLLTMSCAKKRGFKTDDILVLALFVFPCAIFGAKIYYCLFSAQTFNFLDIFKIWEPGLAVYGSIIGGVVGAGIYCLIFKKNLLFLADLTVAGIALGQAIGRIGCYFAGCCYGIESKSWLAFFPMSVLIGNKWHYSTFFYESVWNLIGVFILLIIFNKTKKVGSVTGCYLVWYGIGRAWIEAIRGDSLYLGQFKVSQLLSLILICLGLIILAINIYKAKKEKQIVNLEQRKGN